jgi:hypothetical protein
LRAAGAWIVVQRLPHGHADGEHDGDADEDCGGADHGW